MVYPVTALCWVIFTLGLEGIVAQGDKIKVEEKNDNLWLTCPYTTCKWKYEGELNPQSSCELNIGSVWDDPRGIYSCHNDADSSLEEIFIDVYVRKCQNCIELGTATISGFIIADLIMIGLIAMAVYFVSGSETRRPGRASDKQNLIERDQEYQTLGPRPNDQYSHLTTRAKRNAV